MPIMRVGPSTPDAAVHRVPAHLSFRLILRPRSQTLQRGRRAGDIRGGPGPDLVGALAPVLHGLLGAVQARPPKQSFHILPASQAAKTHRHCCAPRGLPVRGGGQQSNVLLGHTLRAASACMSRADSGCFWLSSCLSARRVVQVQRRQRVGRGALPVFCGRGRQGRRSCRTAAAGLACEWGVQTLAGALLWCPGLQISVPAALQATLWACTGGDWCRAPGPPHGQHSQPQLRPAAALLFGCSKGCRAGDGVRAVAAAAGQQVPEPQGWLPRTGEALKS